MALDESACGYLGPAHFLTASFVFHSILVAKTSILREMLRKREIGRPAAKSHRQLSPLLEASAADRNLLDLISMYIERHPDLDMCIKLGSALMNASHPGIQDPGQG